MSRVLIRQTAVRSFLYAAKAPGSQKEALTRWGELQQFITPDESKTIKSAWFRHIAGCGAEQLEATCAAVIKRMGDAWELP